MKKVLKKLFKRLKKRLSSNLLPVVIYFGTRVLYATMRVTFRGMEIPVSFHQKNRGVILAFWHSMILMATSFPYRGNGAHVLVSRHGDGELIGRVIKHCGFFLVRGSSSKGGKEALHELVTLIRGNRDVAITPDGPRGPAEEVKPGIAQLARLTGAPVIPLAFSGSRLKILRTWDRFRIPWPFSRVVYVCGEPLYYQEGEEFEDFRKRIETALREITAQADAYFRS
ncbi:MAG: lysophospholipid acyltransferase family protein [Thermodesulfovibrionales bacterium]